MNGRKKPANNPDMEQEGGFVCSCLVYKNGYSQGND